MGLSNYGEHCEQRHGNRKSKLGVDQGKEGCENESEVILCSRTESKFKYPLIQSPHFLKRETESWRVEVAFQTNAVSLMTPSLVPIFFLIFLLSNQVGC